MNSKPIRVLLIEDNPDDADLLQEFLASSTRTRFALEVAPRLMEGLQRLAHDTFDTVLLDLGLPDSQGLDTLTRATAETAGVPIIVLTGLTDEAVGIEAMQKGAQDYLMKGEVDEKLLERAIHYAIERKQVEVELQQHRDQLEVLVAERTANLRRISRAYQTFSQCNQAIVHATSETDLLWEICRIIVDIGEYRMAWVGFAEHDEAKTVRPVAWAGFESGYLDTLNITWADSERGCGPIDTAIRTGRPSVMQHIRTDSDFVPWRDDALKRGYASSIALPLAIDGQVIGALSIYGAEPGVFDAEAAQMLVELTSDLTYGIMVLRAQAERERAEQTYRESTSFIETIISSANDGIIVYDPEFRPRVWNHAMEVMTGLSETEMLGQKAHDLVPHLKEQRINRLHKRALAGDSVTSPDTPYHIPRTGKTGWVVGQYSPLRSGSGDIIGIVAIVHDITERKRAEEAEHDQRTLAEALHDTAVAINSTLDFDAVLAHILDNVGRVVPHESANIQIIEESGIAQVIAGRGYENVGLSLDALKKLRLPVDKIHNLQTMFETKQPFIIPETRDYPGWVDAPETRWVRAYLGAPILAEGQVKGFLNLDSATPGFFTQTHADRLQVFANQAAIAIRNARLYQELESYNEFLEQAIEQRTADMQHSTERIEAILNNSSDVIILARPNGNMTQVNLAFDRLFRYSGDEFFQQPLTSIVHADYIEMLNVALRAVVAEEQIKRLEILARRKDNSTFYAEIGLSFIKRRGDRHGSIVCNLRDITDRIQAEEELLKALEKERELSELKTRFVSMTSHEFRTPLTTIVSSTELLERHTDKMNDAQKHRHFVKIQTAAQRMTRLLDEVLVLGKAEAGKVQVNPTSFDLRILCQDVWEEIQLNAGLDIEFVLIIKSQHTNVVMDETLLRHILANLLSNAVKYSPEGGTVRFEIDRGDKHTVIRIADEGIGIPQKDQEHLFEPFHRAKNVGTIHGSGLGLAITKRAVLLHGGSICFESQVGIGTTFTVTLPTNYIPVETSNGEDSCD